MAQTSLFKVSPCTLDDCPEVPLSNCICFGHVVRTLHKFRSPITVKYVHVLPGASKVLEGHYTLVRGFPCCWINITEISDNVSKNECNPGLINANLAIVRSYEMVRRKVIAKLLSLDLSGTYIFALFAGFAKGVLGSVAHQMLERGRLITQSSFTAFARGASFTTGLDTNSEAMTLGAS